MFSQLCIVIAFVLISGFTALVAGQIGTAPLPTQLRAGRRVFVSNMGGECQDFNTPGFTLGHNGQALRHGQVSPAIPTAYDALYSALQNWGRFELVLAPGDADLVFQIRVACPSITEGHPVVEPQILDPKTRVALWGFVENADPAGLQKNRDKNFERALARLTDDVKALFARAASAETGGTN